MLKHGIIRWETASLFSFMTTLICAMTTLLIAVAALILAVVARAALDPEAARLPPLRRP